MVTQMYAINSWSRQKCVSFAADGLPYVGFPGLSLTPIQESPLLDSPLACKEFDLDGDIHDKWKEAETKALFLEEKANARKLKTSGGFRKQWEAETTVVVETGEKEKTPNASNGLVPSSKSCSVNVQVLQTFVPKEDQMTPSQKRSHICKLLLFALIGFVVIAGIVIWVFSPAFT